MIMSKGASIPMTTPMTILFMADAIVAMHILLFFPMVLAMLADEWNQR